MDQDSPIWQYTFQKMKEMMRPVVDFLNDLDEDIDENTRERSPLLGVVNSAQLTSADKMVSPMPFRAPARGSVIMGPRMTKIQYSRSVDDIEFLEEALSVNSAKAVGEKTFDLALGRQRRG